MTEEQKEKFCIEYCRYLDDSKRRLKCYEGMLDFSEYCKCVEKENSIVEKACEKCPLNEAL